MSDKGQMKPARSNQPPKGKGKNKGKGKANAQKQAAMQLKVQRGVGNVSDRPKGQSKPKNKKPQGRNMVDLWTDMLCNQDAEQVLAPALAPKTVSKAPFSHNMTFKQGAELDQFPVGPLLFVQRSAIKGSFYATSSGVPDALAPRQIDFIATLSIVNNVVSRGGVDYSDSAGEKKFAKLVQGNAGLWSIAVNTEVGTDAKIQLYASVKSSAKNTGTTHKMKFSRQYGAGIVKDSSAEILLPLDAAALVTMGAVGADPAIDVIGVLPQDSSLYTYSITVMGQYFGRFPNFGSNPFHLDLVKQEPLADVDPKEGRITAAQMLVSDFTSKLASAGECLTARVPERLLLHSNSIDDLRQRIKALPERNRWRSGHACDGGYVWWLPAEMNDYEFGSADQWGDDNCNVCIFDLAATGSVRVASTWKFEWYTEDQTRTRLPTPTLTDDYGRAFSAMALLPAVSSNLTHEELIAYIDKMAGYLETAQKVGRVALTVGEVLATLF